MKDDFTLDVALKVHTGFLILSSDPGKYCNSGLMLAGAVLQVRWGDC